MCPTLLIIDPLASEDRIGLPFDAFASIDQLSEESAISSSSAATSSASKVFVHLPSVVEAEEAEDIGVEHLLRDVKDNAVSDLSTKITDKLDSLRALQQQLSSIESYLETVLSGKLPRNPAILYRLQEIFNLHPDVHSSEARKALTVANNDQSMMIFAGSVMRSVVALHELINNKIEDQTVNSIALQATATKSN
jgi:26S proteasome regulatory subunit N8